MSIRCAIGRKPGSLAISGNSNLAEHGGWERRVDGVEAGAWYRFAAYYRAEAVAAESWQVVARLDWRGADGARAGMPDYVYRASRDGEWTRVWIETQAPAKAASVVVQLYLSNAPQGTVWWDDISLDRIPDPGPRRVSVASINLRPARTKSAEENVRLFLETVEAKVPPKTDVILLPEGITVVGNGQDVPRGRGDDSGADDEGARRGCATAVGVHRGGDLRARGSGDLQHRGADRSQRPRSRASIARCTCRARRSRAD